MLFDDHPPHLPDLAGRARATRPPDFPRHKPL